jgi:hypothetical protein
MVTSAVASQNKAKRRYSVGLDDGFGNTRQRAEAAILERSVAKMFLFTQNLCSLRALLPGRIGPRKDSFKIVKFYGIVAGYFEAEIIRSVINSL